MSPLRAVRYCAFSPVRMPLVSSSLVAGAEGAGAEGAVVVVGEAGAESFWRFATGAEAGEGGGLVSIGVGVVVSDIARVLCCVVVSLRGGSGSESSGGGESGGGGVRLCGGGGNWVLFVWSGLTRLVHYSSHPTHRLRDSES